MDAAIASAITIYVFCIHFMNCKTFTVAMKINNLHLLLLCTKDVSYRLNQIKFWTNEYNF